MSLDRRKPNDVLLYALRIAVRDQEELIRCCSPVYRMNNEIINDAKRDIKAFKREIARLEKAQDKE
jgi:uncharacterized C2H2 Zn-finger protein